MYHQLCCFSIGEQVFTMSLHSGRLSVHSARFLAIFSQNLALYNKNKSPSVSGPMCDRFPRKFDVQTSYKPSNYILRLILLYYFVVNVKFPQATYHTIVPSTEELCCLSSYHLHFYLHILQGTYKDMQQTCNQYKNA